MTRFLLTLLALLTGLAAQTAPAEARVSGVAAVAAELAGGGERQVAAARLADRPAVGQQRRARAAALRSLPTSVVIPALFVGIDRARE